MRAATPRSPGNLPAGIPAPHKIITIDDDGRVLVSSRHLALGYLDPAADAGRFIRDADGLTTFRTGDRGAWEGPGLILHGRMDDAVKVRGYLVEPSEIREALLRSGDLADAAVITRVSDSGATELVAYVVPDGRVRTPPTSVIRARLRASLPSWMVPAHIVELTALPRTGRGKLDRDALPDPPARRPQPPVDALESALAEVWASALRLDSVGRNENVYALGADSLTVAQILADVTRSTGVRLTEAEAAAAPTVAEMAATIESRRVRAQRARLSPTTVRLHDGAKLRGGEGVPVFCFTGAGASALTFVPFAHQMAGTAGIGAIHAFTPNGLDNRGLPDWTVAAAARRHLRDLRRIAPHGPYVLVGHSLGGFIALEAARRLRADGGDVRLVVAVDTFVPARIRGEVRRTDPAVTMTPERPPLPRRELWRRRLLVPFAGLYRSPARAAQAMEEIGVRVGRLHRPKPYDGPVLLVQGSDNVDDPHFWETTIARGEFTVARVDSDHVSIVREPHINEVVSLIRDHLHPLAG